MAVGFKVNVNHKSNGFLELNDITCSWTMYLPLTESLATTSTYASLCSPPHNPQETPLVLAKTIQALTARQNGDFPPYDASTSVKFITIVVRESTMASTTTRVTTTSSKDVEETSRAESTTAGATSAIFKSSDHLVLIHHISLIPGVIFDVIIPDVNFDLNFNFDLSFNVILYPIFNYLQPLHY
ncbi:hypothetical protein T440DRAFT_480775 [Plenodomus tracheiphilus IPT5]|uniref:Uncharacterized protein n=1 Tax=Plenodomus tracheiphilus IPT5 TaxID=1408161 RepID=A0A6A7AZK4_9PLEO|nr:hypothetical protein T440DRAFT_480775 [Plenodomus tracheiphilus IPT5]